MIYCPYRFQFKEESKQRCIREKCFFWIKEKQTCATQLLAQATLRKTTHRARLSCEETLPSGTDCAIAAQWLCENHGLLLCSEHKRIHSDCSVVELLETRIQFWK